MTFIRAMMLRHALIGLLVACTLATAFVLPSASISTTTHKSSSSHLHAATNEGFIQVSRPDGSEHQLAYRVVRPMSLSSAQAAPIVALHGGPSIPSNYLYPLEDVVPYRSIVFYDQLGCGKSDEPTDITQYSIQDSVEDLKVLLKKLGVRRFHLYGQSYGGILAFEYMKSVANNSQDNDDDAKCLSAILSSAPTNVAQVEGEFVRLLDELKKSNKKDNDEELTDAELEELFKINHQCRLPEFPTKLKDAYANAGSVWRGTDAIKDYVATPPNEGASRMPSALIMRGEYDFVSEECIESWKSAFNTKFLRYRTLQGCSHHGERRQPQPSVSIGGLCHLAVGTMAEGKNAITSTDTDDNSEIRRDAFQQASNAMGKYENEKDISKHIKQFFDGKYGPNWHCVVGKGFATYATYEAKKHIFFYQPPLAILIYKMG